jgi:hypothetical protein
LHICWICLLFFFFSGFLAHIHTKRGVFDGFPALFAPPRGAETGLKAPFY